MRLIGSLFVGPVFVAVAKPAQQNAILLAGFHILSLHTGVFAIQADKAIFEGGGGGRWSECGFRVPLECHLLARWLTRSNTSSLTWLVRIKL